MTAKAPGREPRKMLDDAISELESAVERGLNGEQSAYVSAAAQLRKIMGTGEGNELLERVVPGETIATPAYSRTSSDRNVSP